MIEAPKGYDIVKDGGIEPDDLILNGVVKGWHEPYVMWMGLNVKIFEGVARRKSEGGGGK